MPFSSNLVADFWRENSNMVQITKDNLTFEKNLPLDLRLLLMRLNIGPDLEL